MSRAGKGSRAKLQPPKEEMASSPQGGSNFAGPSERRRKLQKITVWPEFSESDISSEKWDVGAKGKEKGKSALYEDPDGMVELPPCLFREIETWKRPSEFIADKTPVVVEAEREFADLVVQNLHILNSEFMRWMVSHVELLWQLHNKTGIAGRVKENWKPWDHIYPKPRGQPTPNYNLCGKYCVKLFWLGLWRKVTVDDLLPVNKDNQLLLPVSQPHELWLPLLTKAVLKVVALDCNREKNPLCEFGDSSIARMLTGWMVEVLPVRSGHKDAMWNIFSRAIPIWSFSSVPDTDDLKQETPATAAPAAGKGKNKAEQSQPRDMTPKKEDYSYVLFASYGDRSSQEKATDDPAALRSVGLPAGLPHVVMLTQTRKQPLDKPHPPDPDSLIPAFAYQGFKSRKQREIEAKQIAEELEKVNCKLVEMVSPFMNLDGVISEENLEILSTCASDPSQQLKLNLDRPDAVDKGETQEARKTSTWISYDKDFLKCFSALYVLHKPGGYKQKQAVQDMTNVLQTMYSLPGGLKKDKGASTSNLQSASGAPHYSRNHPNALQVGPNGLNSHLLCVDSTKSIDIILTVSTITHWPYKGVKKSQKSLTGSMYAMGEVQEDAEAEEPRHTLPALLVAEEYQWDSVVAGQPLLKITTTGTRSSALCLPAGRHLVQFHVSAPICYHLELWSLTDFVFQEEDEVLNELTKESLRYQTHATSVLTTIATVVGMFEEIKTFRAAFYQQGDFHRGRDITAYHCLLLYASLLGSLRELLPQTMWTNDMVFSWKAFAQEGFRLFLQGLEKDVPKHASEIDKLKFSDLKFPGDKWEAHTVPVTWVDREATEKEHQAATLIQAHFRGYWQHKIWKTVTQGSPEHKKACELLDRSLETITEQSLVVALKLFDTMFKKDPQLLAKFPFKDDEWSRACFEDHTGHYKEQPGNSTFLMFRETFYVKNHGVLIVPHLYTSVPTCSLRVLNNDTGEEIPRVFQRVAPYIYTRNKHGYTFVAEGRSGVASIAEGRCRLRLIGTEKTLLRPKNKGMVNCEFYTKELREYYLPNRDYEFFRHTVNVTENMVVTVQLETSKWTAYIKLQVLDTIDNVEQEVKFARGRGYAIIPAFTFLKDSVRSESPAIGDSGGDSPESIPEDGRGSQLTTHTNEGQSEVSGTSRRRESISAESQIKESTEDLTVGEPKGTDDMEEQEKDSCDKGVEKEKEFVVHKYILRGVVERDSWSENDSAWEFYSQQKAAERQHEMENGRPGSSASDRGQSALGKKGKGGKGWTKAKTVVQPTAKPVMQFDSSVPHWTMKIVTLEKQQACIEVKKDTEREDEIRAMKKAWEEKEPGRAAKAKSARQKFLASRTLESKNPNTSDRDDVSERVTEEHAEDVAEGQSNVTSSNIRLQVGNSRPESGVSRHSSGISIAADASLLIGRKLSHSDDLSPFNTRKPIRQVDYSAFVRKCPLGVKPKLLDPNELKKREETALEELNHFRSVREAVKKARERDRLARNRAKKIQLETAEAIQMDIDDIRGRFNQMREACRLRQLEDQQKKANASVASPQVEDEAEEAQPKPKSPSRKGKKK